eukprot:CAMPEP_0202898004 /NCGR_PEP_ID=MMETSP1392-20130828/6625_1 /ASSEMBLY_ACC=CAM_ASM_000868 /TAXON_ID=225041 /ORGANISM="Chlamydomonas chlamydogama, Strain SAG 11-48b" /LENGTH=48 /DNA_ID= /DNA_START= /DNA_END= /DNA_ORIENTATION=
MAERSRRRNIVPPKRYEDSEEIWERGHRKVQLRRVYRPLKKKEISKDL